ncbi:MAG: DUF2474 domain-containing protein [Metakosakonia sp.]|jgi:hypothetical protein|nr:DUF2474 domain-containing protein [Phytobacter sp.]MBV8874753.1 DUF2474 domain-containing protein [Phytobacter sp.]
MKSKQSGTVKKVMWFISLWFGSVLALFIASTLIKLLMTMAGLHT